MWSWRIAFKAQKKHWPPIGRSRRMRRSRYDGSLTFWTSKSATWTTLERVWQNWSASSHSRSWGASPQSRSLQFNWSNSRDEIGATWRQTHYSWTFFVFHHQSSIGNLLKVLCAEQTTCAVCHSHHSYKSPSVAGAIKMSTFHTFLSPHSDMSQIYIMASLERTHKVMQSLQYMEDWRVLVT